MRPFLPILLAFLFLPACSPEPVVDFDLRYLDGVPAIPLLTSTGCGTALLLDDGTILTCSHAIPRGQFTGDLGIGGTWTRYTVLSSGDNIGREWTKWQDGVPPNLTSDWALLTTDPAFRPSSFFHPVIPAPIHPTHSPPPQPGQTVFVVGYTVEYDNSSEGPARPFLVRHWVPLIVIDPPTDAFAATTEPVIWLYAASSDASYLQNPASEFAQGGRPDAFSARGFSGAPVLRRTPEGGFESCAIIVAGDCMSSSGRGRLAVAIPIPESITQPAPPSPRASDTPGTEH